MLTTCVCHCDFKISTPTTVRPYPSLKLHLYLGASRFSPLRVVASMSGGSAPSESGSRRFFYLSVNPTVEFVFLLRDVSCDIRALDS